MESDATFQIVQILYWLALSTWFGAVIFIALAAPVVFRTVRENNPLLPHVLSVNLEGQHGTLLAGTIVGAILARLSQVQMICAGAILLAMLLQPIVIDLSTGADLLRSNKSAYVIRLLLFIAAIATVLYDWRILWPRIMRHRKEYLDNADDPDIANPAKDKFDAEHRRSVTLLMIIVALLLGMIVFSGNIRPRGMRVELSEALPVLFSI